MPDNDFTLEDWTVRPSRYCIERGDERIRIKPKSMAVLERLAVSDGNVATRDELFDAVWPGASISDDALTQCIVELRKAFGDSARNARFIETIPKKGFRLVPSVVPVPVDGRAEDLRPTPSASTPASTPHRSTAWLPILSACALLIVATVAWLNANTSLELPPATQDGDKSIAVLPFVDISPDGDQEYFADGLSEELISRLAQLQGLNVSGRTSSFFFKNRNDDLRMIGEQLNVDHILTGSVRRADDQLRISARLIEVSNGFHLWSNQYDRPFEDVFKVQQEIATAVAGALSIRLEVGELGTMVGGTNSTEAYEELMLGSAKHRDLTAENMLLAIAHYRRATEIDPDYAIAWSQLAAGYRHARLSLGPSEERRRRSEEAMNKALQLAPTSPRVLASAAYMYLDKMQWAEVERMLQLATGANNDSRVKDFSIDFMVKVGRGHEALTPLETLHQVDPLNPGIINYLSHVYAMTGRNDEAIAELERGFHMNGMPSAIAVAGMMASMNADDPELLRIWLARAIERQQPGSFGVHDAMMNRLDDRETALAWLHDRYAASNEIDFYITVWAAYLGDPELALNAMQRTPDPWNFWLPITAEVRQLPGFKTLMQDIGLEAYWREFGWGDFCRPTGNDDFECS